ncbi:MAG TPA: DNA primase [Bacteroidia bacterium]|jgi:DNA primase|nr:DNA primase [Bacteroidia bacterium]
MIPRETIDAIFSTARIEEVVGDFVNLKKRGVNYMGLCPFHNEKTPSFTVSPAKGIYKCFGCARGGNVVNFVMEHEQMDYVNALKYLARKYKIEIVEEERTAEQREQDTERESLMIVCSFAQKFFSEQLHTETGKAIGLSYLEERGFNTQTIEKFQLGYSPENSKSFLNAALQAGYKLKFLLRAGLVRSSEEEIALTQNEPNPDHCYDRFAGRVMFPVHNVSGNVIAFGGRTLRKDKNVAKYVNSPETPLYHKSNVLYGLNLARRGITAEDNCLLVEGYADVISLFQSGIENVVASSGTSLTIEQIRLIHRYTPNLTILYDGDAAGVKASERGFNLALREGMNVKIVTLPAEDDPDTFARKHSSEELKQYLHDNAMDFIVYKTRALSQIATNDPIKKAELIKEIVATIAVIPERITRSVYVKECSRIMDIEEATLVNELVSVRRKVLDDNTRQAIPVKPIPVHSNNIVQKDLSSLGQERELISVLMKYGDVEATFIGEGEPDEEPPKIKMKIAEFIIENMKEDDFVFENPVYRKIYEDYTARYEKGEPVTEDYFLKHEDTEINQMAVSVFMDTHILADWDRRDIGTKSEKDDLAKTTEKAVYGLKANRIEAMIRELQESIKYPLSDDELIQRMTRKIKLDTAKLIFKHKLGRVI